MFSEQSKGFVCDLRLVHFELALQSSVKRF